MNSISMIFWSVAAFRSIITLFIVLRMISKTYFAKTLHTDILFVVYKS